MGRSQLPPAITGCVLSNELLDAMPVHRFVIEGGHVRELYVTLKNGNFAEEAGEPPTPDIEKRLGPLARSLPDGYRGEVNLGVSAWAEQVSRALARGFVLTIDYGHDRAALYSPERRHGTLRTYYRHTLGHDPLRHIGEQDMTAHVDFTAVDEALAARGVAKAGHATQREFLLRLGLDSFIRRLRGTCRSQAEADANRAGMIELVKPEGMGAFKVAVHRKGIGPVRIAGLDRPAGAASGDGLPMPLLDSSGSYVRLLEGAYHHAAQPALPTWDEIFSEEP